MICHVYAVYEVYYSTYDSVDSCCKEAYYPHDYSN